MNRPERHRTEGPRLFALDQDDGPMIDDVARLQSVSSGLSRQTSAYRRVIVLCDEIADAALRGADAPELTRVCAALLERTVVLLDASFALLTSSGNAPSGAGPASWDPQDPSIRRLLAALGAEGRPLRVPAVPDSVLAHGCVATPIAVGTQKLGYLLILEDAGDSDSDDVDLLVASHAATLFALTLANERSMVDLGRRYQGAIVDSLLSGHFLDREDACRKAGSLGLTDAQPFRVGVLRAHTEGTEGIGVFMASPETRHLLGELAAALPASIPGAVVSVRGSEVAVVLPEEPDALDSRGRCSDTETLRSLTRLLTETFADTELTCGVSEPTACPDLAPRRLRQAEYAAEVGVRIGRAGQVIRYDQLGIYRLLLQVGDLRQLGEFADEVLGALTEYDATHSSDLVRTLSVFLNQHASLKQAARKLGVHANTISYRIQRIEQLTPLNLADPDDRLAAHVAVKIIESQYAGLRDRYPNRPH